jgi:hypothetical protein
MCKLYGVCQFIYNFQSVANLRDVSVFNEIIQPSDFLHNAALPCVKTVDVLRRPRGHNFTLGLPKCKYDFTKTLKHMFKQFYIV